jgi:hypothetical protein
MHETTPIDFPLAIERNREALLRVVVTLFGMLGLVDGVILGRVSKARSNATLRILRLAESAVRRLIVAAARGMVAKPRPSKPFPKGTKIPKGTGASNRTPAFKLSDTHEPWMPPPSRRKKKNPGPRITVLGGLDPTGPALLAHQQAMFRRDNPHLFKTETEPKSKPERPPGDGTVDGARLQRRLRAIMAALQNIPRQAQRLANWKARRETQIDAGKLVHTSPLRDPIWSRPKEPSSHRDFSTPRDPLRREAENLLDECDWLAWQAMKIDSS